MIETLINQIGDGEDFHACHFGASCHCGGSTACGLQDLQPACGCGEGVCGDHDVVLDRQELGHREAVFAAGSHVGLFAGPPPSGRLTLVGGGDGSSSGDASYEDKSDSNYNITIRKISNCEYVLTLHLWVNEDYSAEQGCSAEEIEGGKQQIRDALREYWSPVVCRCGEGMEAAVGDAEGCKLWVDVDFAEDGSPTPGSGSNDRPNSDPGAVKKGGPAEVYFKCGDLPVGGGEQIGEGRQGDENFNGFIWVYAGDANQDSGLLVPGTAHEIGHNLAGGDYHNNEDPGDLMHPLIDPEDHTPDWEYFVSGAKRPQTVGNRTACQVVSRFARDKLCEDCCRPIRRRREDLDPASTASRAFVM